MDASNNIWPSAFSREGRNAISHILDLLDEFAARIEEGPVAHDPELAPLSHWLGGLTFDSPADPVKVAEEILQHHGRANVHTIHPRYFGLFNPAPIVWGEIADMIMARLNPQLATWSHAPAAVEIEQHVLRFMISRIGLEEASAFFTSGGEEANRCGVQTALTNHFPDYPGAGLRCLHGQPVLYVSAQSHLAWIKIASSLGLGRAAVRLVPTDAELRMDVDALNTLIQRDRAHGRLPFFVGATAGTTSAGVIDPLAELKEVAVREGLHLHVDAAWAGAVMLSDRWRGLLNGINLADSITIDAHKWLSQPMGTGMFFCRGSAVLEAAFGVSASYMPPAVEGRLDYYRTSPSWSRRWLGLRLFFSLAVAGRQGFEAQIDQDIALGEQLRTLLGENGWTCVNRTRLPVVGFIDESRPGDAEWHRKIASAVTGSGEAWISTVTLGEITALRACITNWRSRSADVHRLVYALNEARRG
jgi:glutamate/tyrosine decarboxylase-like PLP-dependent enzyme